MAGTPGCGAWVCKCIGGFVPERELRKHFDKAGLKRHNDAWEARMSQQKRVVATVRTMGANVPEALQRRIDRSDIISVTETECSVGTKRSRQSKGADDNDGPSARKRRTKEQQQIDKMEQDKKRAQTKLWLTSKKKQNTPGFTKA